jgi:hypothetical protein
MAFYLCVRLAVVDPGAGDLLTGKTTWSSLATLAWPGSARRDNPTHSWITVRRRTLAAVTIAVIGHLLPGMACMV